MTAAQLLPTVHRSFPVTSDLRQPSVFGTDAGIIRKQIQSVRKQRLGCVHQPKMPQCSSFGGIAEGVPRESSFQRGPALLCFSHVAAHLGDARALDKEAEIRREALERVTQ